VINKVKREAGQVKDLQEKAIELESLRKEYDECSTRLTDTKNRLQVKHFKRFFMCVESSVILNHFLGICDRKCKIKEGNRRR